MTRILSHISFAATAVPVDLRPRATAWMDAAGETGAKTPDHDALAVRRAP